ncbi:MAG: hypothetical protein IME97_02825 [Proteobacteria bacterium]|nr:hypothetical protein [Pseudomonadota bacterium]
MKHSILTLVAIFFLFPLTATGDPEKQQVSSSENKQAVTHQVEEAESTAFSATAKSVKEGSSTKWQEDIYEMEADKAKADNIADTKEAIAEDILLNK